MMSSKQFVKLTGMGGESAIEAEARRLRETTIREIARGIARPVQSPVPGAVIRTPLTKKDRCLVEKWKVGTGMTADIARSVARQGWISEKQRAVLHRDGKPIPGRHPRGIRHYRRGEDVDYESDYEQADYYGISPWGG